MGFGVCIFANAGIRAVHGDTAGYETKGLLLRTGVDWPFQAKAYVLLHKPAGRMLSKTFYLSQHIYTLLASARCASGLQRVLAGGACRRWGVLIRTPPACCC